MRKLKFEHLENRCLLSADIWPQGLGFAADFFNHAGAGLTTRGYGAGQAYIGATSIDLKTKSVALTRSTIVGNANDLNGVLFYPDGQNRVPAGYMQGGTGSARPNTERAVQNQWITFVNQGGVLFGSCRGAYQAAYTWGIKIGNSGARSGSQTVVMPPGHPISDFLIANGVEDLTLRNVRHYGGPRFPDRPDQLPDTYLYGEVTSGVARGTAFLLEHQPKGALGWVSVVPSHPEYANNLTTEMFAAGWLDHAVNLGQRVPDLKGILTEHEQVIERIGDKQYHRWQIEVQEEDLAELTISLSGMSANADLFIQYEGYAHEYSYLASSTLSGITPDTITIPNPAPGVYEVSVRGTHSRLNGSLYTLRIGSPDPIDRGQLAAYIATQELGRGLKTVFDGELAKILSGRNPAWNAAFVSWTYFPNQFPLLNTTTKLVQHFKDNEQYTPKPVTNLEPGDFLHFKNYSAIVIDVIADTIYMARGGANGRVISGVVQINSLIGAGTLI